MTWPLTNALGSKSWIVCDCANEQRNFFFYLWYSEGMVSILHRGTSNFPERMSSFTSPPLTSFQTPRDLSE